MIEIGIVTIGSRISKKDVHKSDIRLIGAVVHRVLFLIIRHKVNRCLARYNLRAMTTNQQTNRAPNEPARPLCAQESILWAKFGRFWAKNPNLYGSQ